ncbi:MAG: DUF4347 domain-containing protein [Gammaproteobacteria bacterium]|nr:DUF4347 domain-containing protein [Gammaproteobacteria bacterium]
MDELEPRILMSASLEGLLVNDNFHEVNDINYTEPSEHLIIAENETLIAPEVNDEIRHELVIVNSNTPNFQSLVDGLLKQQNNERQFDVLILNNNQNGIEQITTALSNYQNLDAVHLISQGSNGQVQLGDSNLSYENIDTYSSNIANWGNALSQNADFLIYGCDLSSGDTGLNLIDSLSVLAGTDIAENDDLNRTEKPNYDPGSEYKYSNTGANTAFNPEAQQPAFASWAVNDTLIDVNNTVVTNEDTTYVFTLSDFNFSNFNSDRLEHIFITNLESFGSLKLNGVDVSSYQDITAAQIAAGDFVFTPTTNANGINYDHFEFLVHDGSVYSENAYTLTINVNSVNDDPVVMNNTLTIETNTLTTINIATLVAYGSDLDGDTLKLAQFTQPGQGTLIDNGDGTLRYLPESNYNGEDRFTYTLVDGQGGSVIATLTLIITPVENILIPENLLNAISSTNEVSETAITLSENSAQGLTQSTQQQNQATVTLDASQTRATLEQAMTTNNKEDVTIISSFEEKTNESQQEKQTDQQDLENNYPIYYWDDQPGSFHQRDTDFSQFKKINSDLTNNLSVSLGVAEFLAQTSQSKDNSNNINIYNHNYNTHSLYINNTALWNALDEMAISMSNNTTNLDQQQELMVSVATGAAWSLSAGIVASSLRSGSLIASLMASVPLWNWFDPLPVLSLSDKELIKQQKQYNNEADKENKKYRFLKKIVG